MTKAHALALLMLATFLATSFRKGWTRNESDFPNYYTGAVLVRKGAPLRNFYDWTWFQRQMSYAGIEQLGAYLPQTPLTMLPIVPLATVPVQTAKQLWLALNLAFLGATFWILSSVTRIGLEYVAILAFFGCGSLQSNFRLGQYYVFLLLLLTLAFYCLDRGMSAGSGFLCGVAFGLKLYGGPFLLYFIVKRNWKAVAGMLAATVVAILIAIVIFGWGDVRFYATQILPRSVEGEVIDPYNPGNGSLTTFLRHSLVMEPDLNPQPLRNAPFLFFFLRPFTAFLILGCTLLGLFSSDRIPDRRGFAWFTIAVMLLSSNAASYTYILLLLPVILLLPDAGLKKRVFLIASYIALNFFLFPAWLPLFPKLWILVALFLVEGRDYLRSLRPRIVIGLFITSGLLAAFDAQRHEARYLLEPGRHCERVALDKGTFSSTYPTISSAGLFYQAMVQKGYVLRWLHEQRMEEFAFDGQVFQPVAPSLEGPIYFDLVKGGACKTMSFDPATRQATLAPAPLPNSNRSVISPNGRWLAFETAQAGATQIWLRDLVRGGTAVLAAGNCNSSSPVWEEDSHSLIFASDCGRGLGLPVLYRATLPFAHTMN